MVIPFHFTFKIFQSLSISYHDPIVFFPGRHCDGIIALLGSGLQNGKHRKHRSFATSQSEDLREDIKSLA
jgi:hypothetical protein